MARKRLEKSSHSHTMEVGDSWAQERPDLDQTALLHLIYVMRMGRMLERSFDRYTRAAFGISGADARVLLALRRAGAPYARRPTDLFRALLVTSGAITKQVDRLCRIGLVLRRPDPGHGAGFLVELTERGLEIADHVVQNVAAGAFLGEGRSPFTAREQQRMMDLSLKMITSLERQEALAGEDEA